MFWYVYDVCSVLVLSSHIKEAGLRFLKEAALSLSLSLSTVDGPSPDLSPCGTRNALQSCKELLMNGSMAEIKQGFLLAAAEGRSQWQQFRRTMGEAPAYPRLPNASQC